MSQFTIMISLSFTQVQKDNKNNSLPWVYSMEMKGLSTN